MDQEKITRILNLLEDMQGDITEFVSNEHNVQFSLLDTIDQIKTVLGSTVTTEADLERRIQYALRDVEVPKTGFADWDLIKLKLREAGITGFKGVNLGSYLLETEAQSKPERDTIMEQYTVIRDDDSDLTFTGERIGSYETSSNNASVDYSGQTGIWHTLSLYRTAAGKYICEYWIHNQWQGSTDTHRGAVCDTEAEVVEFFGADNRAKELYADAGIDAAETVA